MWIALHAPSAAPELLGAGGIVLLWAVLADGSFGVARIIGYNLHRRTLVVIGVGIGLLPVVTGNLASLEVSIPCFGAAVVLLRLGLVRAATVEAPPSVAATPPVAGRTDGPPSVMRRAGRITDRTGTMAADKVDVAASRWARAAGRVAGRHRPPASR